MKLIDIYVIFLIEYTYNISNSILRNVFLNKFKLKLSAEFSFRSVSLNLEELDYKTYNNNNNNKFPWFIKVERLLD